MSASTFLVTTPPPIYISGSNVGIGDNTPTSTLDVLGNETVTAVVDAVDVLRINRADGARTLSVGTKPFDTSWSMLWLGTATPNTVNFSLAKTAGQTELNDDTAVTIRIADSFSPVALTITASAVTVGPVFFPAQAPTASAPAYVKGGMYFDTTLNKLRIGGATGWETVTSV